MSYVNIDAQPVIDAASAAIAKILREREQREAKVADAVIAFCGGRSILGLKRGKTPADRVEAVRLLESKYGFNDELLADLTAAKRLHADTLHELQQLVSAAQLAVKFGDKRITLSLHHASMLSHHINAEVTTC